MKFTISRSRFLDGLKAVQNIASNKSSMPVLQNVLLQAKDGLLCMTASDLDLTVRTAVECEVSSPGGSTLPVRLLFNSVSKAAEGMIEIEIGDDNIGVIKAGSARFRIAGIGEAEYPKLPTDDDSFAYELDFQTLKEMLRKTSYASSQDDTRRTLKGVLMSFRDFKLTMVATDGRRLALVEKELEFPKDAERDIVLPSKAVQELQRVNGSEDKVSIKIQQSQICFEIGQTKLYSKLIDDTYPNYIQVIPKSSNEKITIDRQLLLDALERASVMTMDEAHSTKLIFEENRLTVTSAVSELGSAKDEVPIKYAGEKIEIMFNPSYVMDPLKAIDDDEIRIELNDGHSPAVIKCSIPFLYVLMPLRIS